MAVVVVLDAHPLVALAASFGCGVGAVAFTRASCTLDYYLVDLVVGEILPHLCVGAVVGGDPRHPLLRIYTTVVALAATP